MAINEEGAGAQLAALATVKALAIEHGETFIASCLVGVLLSHVVAPNARTSGATRRRYMTRAKALRIVAAIREA